MKKLLIFLLLFPSVSLAQYDVDMLGSTRGGDGVWDRGAYEYNSGYIPPNEPPTYNLSLYMTGEGRIVYRCKSCAGATQEADCTYTDILSNPTKCLFSLTENAIYQITATSYAGYRWTATSGAAANAKDTTVTMTAPKFVTATFSYYPTDGNGVRMVACSGGENTADCDWDSILADNPTDPLDHYTLYYNHTGVMPYDESINVGTDTTYTLTGISAGEYYFAVQASADDGTGRFPEVSDYSGQYMVTVTDSTSVTTSIPTGCTSDAGCSSPTPRCLTSTGVCVQCLGGSDCDDGLYCTGVENCSGYACLASSGNPCSTGYTCNDTVDQCIADDPTPPAQYDVLVDFESNDNCSAAQITQTDHNTTGSWTASYTAATDCHNTDSEKNGTYGSVRDMTSAVVEYLRFIPPAYITGPVSWGYWFNTSAFDSTGTNEYVSMMSIRTDADYDSSFLQRITKRTTSDFRLTMTDGSSGLSYGEDILSENTWYYTTCRASGATAIVECSLYDANLVLLQDGLTWSARDAGSTNGLFSITAIQIWGGSSTQASVLPKIDDFQIDYTDGTYPLMPIQIPGSECTVDDNCTEEGLGKCDTLSGECVECLTAADCTDSVFCNGVESCYGYACIAGTDPCPSSLYSECVEATDSCTARPTTTTSSVVVPSDNATYPPTYFYIDFSDGADNNTGRHPASAYKTLDAISGFSWYPGSVIKFKDGTSGSGSLTINDSGTADNPIKITTY